MSLVLDIGACRGAGSEDSGTVFCHCEERASGGRRGNLRVGIMKERQYYVYIMTNKANTVFYTGVTNDLSRRVHEHREKLLKGFTRRYNATKLVFFEVCNDIQAAIAREKQIKAGSRQDKIELIRAANGEWRDLGEGL